VRGPAGSPERFPVSDVKATIPGLTIQHPRGRIQPRVSHFQPGLAPNRGQGIVDGTPTCTAGVGSRGDDGGTAGPMTFRCPLAMRSTCPPACYTTATIFLASLERQCFGVACLFSTIPGDLASEGLYSLSPSWSAHRPLASAYTTIQRSGSAIVVRHAQPVDLRVRPARRIRAAVVQDARSGVTMVTNGVDEPQVSTPPAHAAG
jgi:hypothetical protein